MYTHSASMRLKGCRSLSSHVNVFFISAEIVCFLFSFSIWYLLKVKDWSFRGSGSLQMQHWWAMALTNYMLVLCLNISTQEWDSKLITIYLCSFGFNAGLDRYLVVKKSHSEKKSNHFSSVCFKPDILAASTIWWPGNTGVALSLLICLCMFTELLINS